MVDHHETHETAVPTKRTKRELFFVLFVSGSFS